MDLGISTQSRDDQINQNTQTAQLSREPAVLFVSGSSSDANLESEEGNRVDAAVQITTGGCLQIQKSYSENDSPSRNRILEARLDGGVIYDTPRHEDCCETFTVDKAVDQLGFGRFQLFLSLLCGLAWIVDAMETMLLSVLAPALLCEWRLTAFQEAMVTVTVFTGMFVASSFWGVIADKFGRKFSLVLSSCLTFYFGALTAFSPNFYWVLVLRGLTGAGIAGAPQAVTIYSEFLPTVYRARAIVLLEVFWAWGTILAVTLALLVMPGLGWRYFVFFCALPVLVFNLLCYWLPESARFYMVSGDKEASLKTIRQIAHWNQKPMPLGELVDDNAFGKDKDVDQEEGVESDRRGTFGQLFNKEFLLTTTILWMLWFVAAASYYGIVLSTTEIFSELSASEEKCVTKAQDSDDECWATCQELDTDDYLDILWTTLAEFPGLLIALVLVELFGRKRAIAMEFVLFGVFAFIVSICMPRGLVTFILFTSRAFVVAAFQTVYVYTCEIYPTTIRAIGVGSGSGISRVGAMVTPFIAQVLLKKSIQASMGVYFLLGAVAAVGALFLPTETKGRGMRST